MKTFLKTLLILTLVTAFLLTGCDTNDTSSETSSAPSDISGPTSSAVSEDSSAEVSEDSSSADASSAEEFTTDDIDPIFKTEYSKAPLPITDEDLKYLENQAPILTKHLVLCADDLDGIVTKDEINAFFEFFGVSDIAERADYRYTPIMRDSRDLKYSLYCFEDVNRTAYEVFGEEEWPLEIHLLSIDRKHKVYAAEYGYGLGMRDDCSDFETRITQTTVEVEFTRYCWREKDGDPYPFDEGRYIARFNVMKDEAGAFLRYVGIERP